MIQGQVVSLNSANLFPSSFTPLFVNPKALKLLTITVAIAFLELLGCTVGSVELMAMGFYTYVGCTPKRQYEEKGEAIVKEVFEDAVDQLNKYETSQELMKVKNLKKWAIVYKLF